MSLSSRRVRRGRGGLAQHDRVPLPQPVHDLAVRLVAYAGRDPALLAGGRQDEGAPGLAADGGRGTASTPSRVSIAMRTVAVISGRSVRSRGGSKVTTVT